MSPPQFLFPVVKTFFTPQTDEERERVLSARPFFGSICLIICGLWGYSVFTFPHLRTPVNFTLFTGLISIHGLLHWFTPILVYRPRISPIYLFSQSVLAFGIILFLKDTISILLLYSILLGESIGVLQEVWQRIVGGLFQLALLIVGILIFSSWSNLIPPLWPFLLTIGIILPYIISFGQQDAARQRAQSLLHELEEMHEQLAVYALQVEELTRSQERERIARELHDTLSQGLAGIVLQLEAAISHSEESNPKQTIVILNHTLAGARLALQKSRQAIVTLRQKDAVQGDLHRQIHEVVNHFSDVSRIPYTLDIRSDVQLSKTVQQHILRILAEALSNITRHSRARNAKITAHCEQETFTLTIHDDGVGFVAEEVPSGHFGLLGIRERARLIDATLAIQSGPGQGTTVSLSLPLDKGTPS